MCFMIEVMLRVMSNGMSTQGAFQPHLAVRLRLRLWNGHGLVRLGIGT